MRQVALLIYGDLNGDGNVNQKDVSVLVEHEFYHESRAVLKGLFLEAADINHDGTYSFEDLDLLYKSIYSFGALMINAKKGWTGRAWRRSILEDCFGILLLCVSD